MVMSTPLYSTAYIYLLSFIWGREFIVHRKLERQSILETFMECALAL